MGIYLFDKIEEFSDDLLARSLAVLPGERRIKAERYRNILDQKLCVLGYLLLVYGLRVEYGIAEKIELLYQEKGKPILKKYPDIHFNISHCRVGVVCAIHTEEIGIDIEAVSPYDRELAAHILTADEFNVVAESDNTSRAFTEFWTMKESMLKKNGTGLMNDLKKINTLQSEAVVLPTPNKNYVIGICGIKNENRRSKAKR